MHDDRLKFADVSLGRLSTEALDMVPLFAEKLLEAQSTVQSSRRKVFY